MPRARFDGLLLFLLGSVVFVLLGFAAERVSPVSMVDFKSIYYGARCLLQHSDPYQEVEVLRAYNGERAGRPSVPAPLLRVVTLYINLPTTLLLTTPFAMLPWEPAHLLWMTLTASIFILAAYLMWSLGSIDAPRTLGLLICFFLVSSELLPEIGNVAGITIGLCAIAVWCFVKERFVLAGILCFALSLALKPHDVGLVWLFFWLAGGLYRKRALQTFALTAVLSLSAILWVSHVAPHWTQELHSNLQTISMHGGIGDPGPAGVDPRSHGAILVSLQTVFSVFRDDPRIYNPATYLLCAPLLFAWMLATSRSRSSRARAWLALAAIAALSMLPIFHRQHDTRLLLLTFPACAMLWAEGGVIGWLALSASAAGVVFTGDTPLLLLGHLADYLHVSTATLPGQLLTVMLVRPAPLIMLIVGTFYLCVYWRRAVPDPTRTIVRGFRMVRENLSQYGPQIARKANRSE